MTNPDLLLDNNKVFDTQMASSQPQTVAMDNAMNNNDSPLTLRDCVEETLHNYFTDLDGQPANDIYDMVLSEIEAPLLEVVMRYTQNNQCKAAQVLGLNRGTLRKKLKRYGLL